MKRWVLGAAAGLAAAMGGLVGCGPAPLSRSEQVEILLKENRRLEDLLIDSEKRVAALSTSAGEAAPQASPPAPEDPYAAVAVRFGKFSDVLIVPDRPADERLKVVVEPLDAEGDVVKRLGSLRLEVFEGEATTETPFARWEFSAEDLAKTWLSGLGSYAYVLKLPWPEGRLPQAGPLHLKAWFTPIGGSTVLEAEAPLKREP